MTTIELFAGTCSFSKAMKSAGYDIFTVDINPEFDTSLVADIRQLRVGDFPYKPDILWASPPCQAFSVGSVYRHWIHPAEGVYIPQSETARTGIELVLHTLRLIDELEPKIFFIENPRGMLRKMPYLQHLNRHTVTYCQYGDSRMKPTDIWTNVAWWDSRPPCRAGSSCHVAAPRGSNSGTQGLAGATERGRIPEQLFLEILAQMPGE